MAFLGHSFVVSGRAQENRRREKSLQTVCIEHKPRLQKYAPLPPAAEAVVRSRTVSYFPTPPKASGTQHPKCSYKGERRAPQLGAPPTIVINSKRWDHTSWCWWCQISSTPGVGGPPSGGPRLSMYIISKRWYQNIGCRWSHISLRSYRP